MKTATVPFEFFTVVPLVRVGRQVAETLAGLGAGVEECSDGSIFHHTFQTLGSHHFLTKGFSNDFAQWVLTATNRQDLAEQLAAIDVRDYVSLAELRADLRRIIGAYCEAFPLIATQQALERFWFCEGLEVSVPLHRSASTLEEFQAGIEQMSHASFYYHFISARMRLKFGTNDLSHWLANQLGLEEVANRVNRIDIYTNTLDGARALLVDLLAREGRSA